MFKTSSQTKTKSMKDNSFKDFVLDQLHELEDIEARGMFGGFGLYHDETFFGIVHQGRLYFKVDESTASEYRKRKMKPFRPNTKQTLKATIRSRWKLSKTRNSSRAGPSRRSIARSDTSDDNLDLRRIYEWAGFSIANIDVPYLRT